MSDDTTVLCRARSVDRTIGAVRYVSLIGFQASVHQLEGAAAAVWDALAEPSTPERLAAGLGVADDDPHLLSAVAMLTEAALIRLETRTGIRT